MLSSVSGNGKDSSLWLNVGYNSLSCKLHPVVVLSVLDHFIRRNEGQERVIGTLLGTNDDGVIEITDCFPVPHGEIDTVSVDKEFHHNMFNLHLRANPKLTIVGWYASGGEINENSVRIHDFYWREMQAPPIHLVVDTGLNNSSLGVHTYVSSPLSMKQENSLGFQFKPVQLEFATQSSEKIGLDALMKTKKNKDITGDAGTLSELTSFESLLKQLLLLIDNVSEYVQQVLSGEQIPNPKIGRMLSETLSSLSQMDATSFEKLFTKNQTNLLMLIYLSNLTRTQVKISENLTAL